VFVLVRWLSQRSRRLVHELSPPGQTLGSWVRISFEIRMFAGVCSVLVL
jgi:hypothetical protein